MIRKIAFMAMLSVVLIVAFAIITQAQTASSTKKAPDNNSKAPAKVVAKAPVKEIESTAKKTQESSNMTGTVSEQKMKMPHKTEMAGGMHQMSLADEWAKIEAHYKEMMAITDQARLKEELTRHQQMMTEYRNMMMANHEKMEKMESHEMSKTMEMSPKSEMTKKETTPTGH
jgi:hypothetical protein